MPLSTTNVTKRFSSTPSATVDLIQQYSRVMADVLKTYFPLLNSVPDALYIMMATMELESSFRILHNGSSTASHITPSIIKRSLHMYTYRGIGKAYWNDSVISIAKANPAQIDNVFEGLSSQALMGSMGCYQVRNTKVSNTLMNQFNYRTIAEANGILVNPGASISAVFTNDETGAMRSMILGCMDMQWKYSIFLKRSSSSQAIRKAVGAYLGDTNAADILGTTPNMRINEVFFGKNSKDKALKVSSVFNNTGIYTKPTETGSGQVETKETTVAGTNNVRVDSNGCGRA